MSLVLVLPLVAAAAFAAPPGPVALYKLDEATGEVVRDSTGHGLDGRIVGATWAKGGGLRFDGVDDHVDCGSPDALDLRRTVTLEAWLEPDRVPLAEPGICGKGVDSYGLTYYKDGRCWFYISSGGNNCKAAVAPGFPSYVAGTYDGHTMRLYVNGVLRDSKALEVPINAGGAFHLGDRADAPGQSFPGRIDEVRVHDRALSADEIAAAFAAKREQMLLQRQPVKPVATLDGKGYKLLVGARGGMQLDVGGERYVIETFLSYPGDAVGTDALSEEEPSGEAGWRPEVHQAAPDRIEVRAGGACYRLARTIRLDRGRITITDALTAGPQDVGVLVRHRVVTADTPQQVLLAGADEAATSVAAENPTNYIAGRSSRLGLLAEDTVSRLHFEAATWLNQCHAVLRGIGLKAGTRQELRWALYPFGEEADEFTFVNRVRDDWGSNHTIPGPWSFFQVFEHQDLLNDPAKLRHWLSRNQLKTVALSPWVDYENWNDLDGRRVDRDEYRTLMRSARDAFKAIDPTILCTGCMEGNLVSPPAEVQDALFRAYGVADPPAGIRPATDAQMEVLRTLPHRWHDCLLTMPDGRYVVELYYRGPDKTPLTAMAVYAAPGNGQEAYWLDQARFILEDVGLDGIYIDQFSLAFDGGQRYSYEGWDGTTVELDPATGRIARRCIDAALVGVGARLKLADYVLGRGGVMVTNTCPAVEELQALPLQRFMEAEWCCEPLKIGVGVEPPLAAYPAKGQLGGTLGLGFRPGLRSHDEEAEYARTIYKGLVTYLRHGILWYHYVTDIPEAGPGSGEYGPFNLMFPITPIGLHQGWVEGRERIVTAVSGTYHRGGETRPEVHTFDMTGHELPSRVDMSREGNGWRLDLRVQDWEQVAVIIGASSPLAAIP